MSNSDAFSFLSLARAEAAEADAGRECERETDETGSDACGADAISGVLCDKLALPDAVSVSVCAVVAVAAALTASGASLLLARMACA